MTLRDTPTSQQFRFGNENSQIEQSKTMAKIFLCLSLSLTHSLASDSDSDSDSDSAEALPEMRLLQLNCHRIHFRLSSLFAQAKAEMIEFSSGR